ncbi:hypothetical protein V8J82_08705 [Gymnodinialimonas sp. 2305UL16-5]|uniref:hypothetical protein n=1 Tax=Gymnodinialimonas mytili TaxID=3126503 RepID=UPI0030B0D190
MARNNLYSSIVVWVKITLPLMALALMSTLFLFASNPDPDAALPYAEVDIDQIVREQRVAQPRFAGVLDQGRELIMIADVATIDGTETDRIRAQNIEGQMDLSGDAYLTLDSVFGDFDMAAQQASLTDGVIVTSSLGYQLESERLNLALDAVDVHAPTPVHVTGPGLDLTADTMDLSGPDGATILRFNGSVRVLYEPQN